MNCVDCQFCGEMVCEDYYFVARFDMFDYIFCDRECAELYAIRDMLL